MMNNLTMKINHFKKGREIEKNKEIVEFTCTTNKCTFQIIKINKKIYFKKVLSNNIQNEIKGYDVIKGCYIIPKRISFCKDWVIYEYKNTLSCKTLHDIFYKKNKIFKKYDIIYLQYKKNLNYKKYIDENDSRNSDFFKGRTHMLECLLNNNLIPKEIKYESNKYDLRKIIRETINNINKNKKVLSFVSQGDPTDTNISINGIFTDFENAGYNSIIGEISIAFASFITHGQYFYPKYHESAYKLRPYILNEFEVYKPCIKYWKNEINCLKHKIQKNSLNYFKEYLNIFIKKLSEDEIMQLNEYIKYYLIMRMLTPIDIYKMELDDQYIIFGYIIEIYIKINKLEDLKKFLYSDSIEVIGL
ncbi:MAG: hypothetical protein RSB77_04950 [Bacilli bacterium]